MVDFATTDLAFEELLRQAAAFGGVFDPHSMEVDLPLPSAMPNESDAGVGTQCNAAPEGQEGNARDDLMTGMELIAAQGEEQTPVAVVIGLEKNHHDFMIEVALMNVGSHPTVTEVLDCMKQINDPPMQALHRHLQWIPPENTIVSTSKRPVVLRSLITSTTFSSRMNGVTV